MISSSCSHNPSRQHFTTMASSSYYISQLQMTGTSLFSTYASLTGMLMLVRSMFNDLISRDVRDYIMSLFHYYFHKPPPDQITIIVDERNGYTSNHVYEAAEAYLRTIIDPSINRLNVTKTQRQTKLSVSIEKGQQLMDSYQGIDIQWRYASEERDKESGSRERNCFEIIFDKKFKDVVLESYLPYLMDRLKEIKNEDKVVRMYTRGLSDRDHEDRDDDENRSYSWGSVRLEHPLTFEKLAMDPDQKKLITDDLDRFISRKEFYKRVGKAWKRGYLLYGPPGTGKSSLIAAMANYLKFDIYDLELSSIYSDSELRRVLTSTTNRSILIIEDIDCSIEVQNRERSYDANKSDSKLTLSGLLNFIDGLWSSCGDERIIVFTTNHKDKLDPALLRPGRMDVHIHMSYCTPAGFKLLARNYLGVQDTYPLVEEIESGMIGAQVTPAEVAEELMRSEDPEIALGGVLSLVKRKANTDLKAEETTGDMLQMTNVAEQEYVKVTSIEKRKKRPRRVRKR